MNCLIKFINDNLFNILLLLSAAAARITIKELFLTGFWEVNT